LMVQGVGRRRDQSIASPSTEESHELISAALAHSN
jgi:hypothetical protein